MSKKSDLFKEGIARSEAIGAHKMLHLILKAYVGTLLFENIKEIGEKLTNELDKKTEKYDT